MHRERGNHSKAYDFCSRYGMKLFVIESANTQTQFLNILAKWWSKTTITELWIDGERDVSDGNWYYYSYEKTHAFADLIWMNRSATGSGCLEVSNARETFKVTGENCSSKRFPICEFY